MCLSKVWSEKEQEEWLAKQDDPFVVYNRCQQIGTHFKPLFFDDWRYKKGVNRSWKLLRIRADDGQKYCPHFHRLALLPFGYTMLGEAVVAWECYKKDVTCIGSSWGGAVIIARKLTLLGEVSEKKKEKSA